MASGLQPAEEGCSAADVRLFPFHAAGTGLPELEQGTWRDLVMCSSSHGSAASSGAAEHGPGVRPRQRTAGILLAEPHFIAVGVPTMPAMGHTEA